MTEQDVKAIGELRRAYEAVEIPVNRFVCPTCLANADDLEKIAHSNHCSGKWDWLKVPVPGKGTFVVPVKFNPRDPTKSEIGPLPPEVAEYYEVQIIPTPYLMRKNSPAPQPPCSSPPAASPASESAVRDPAREP